MVHPHSKITRNFVTCENILNLSEGQIQCLECGTMTIAVSRYHHCVGPKFFFIFFAMASLNLDNACKEMWPIWIKVANASQILQQLKHFGCVSMLHFLHAMHIVFSLKCAISCGQFLHFPCKLRTGHNKCTLAFVDSMKSTFVHYFH